MIYPTKRRLAILFLLPLLLFGFAQKAAAVDEPYLNELRGAQIATGNAFTVTDEKWGNTAAWNLISQNITVADIVSFEINYDTSIYFYNKPFKATLNFKIYIYGNQNDTTQITDSVTHGNITLDLRYDTSSGKPYKGIALYKFKGVHKYKVRILSITCPELNPIPAIFRLKGQVLVNRQYNFVDLSTGVTRYGIVNGNQLQLAWAPSNYPGAELFDVEFTHIDDSSSIAATIRSFAAGSEYKVPTDFLKKWFQNNSTRITTAASRYLINVPYNKGFVLFRIRGVQIHYGDDLRWEGEWNYAATAGTCTANCATGVVYVQPHEPALNWQYSAVFAEEGKKKEVMTYYDGALHNRQAVTINNSDNKAVVQETILDALGRPAVNVLPVPVPDSTLHYFRNFNQNSAGQPYSFSDFSTLTCITNAQPMRSLNSGAAKYYSPNNAFLNTYQNSKYIPNAGGYPFSVTEYIADNTGRVAAQGGVGPTFQIDSSHETKYYYGKPRQKELDRLFGTEAGNASHYLKNMVMDPNKQISVSYIDPNGKTIATSLAGLPPANLHPLDVANSAVTHITDDLIQPSDFSRDASTYTLSATTTFLAPVTGSYILNYDVDPLKLQTYYGPAMDSVICSNCYYDLQVVVKDNCNNTLREEVQHVGAIFDTACADAGGLRDTVSVNIPQVGEYYVTYALRLSKDALDYYDSVHLQKNTNIKKLNAFMLDELNETDFYGCYNSCLTCLDDIGTKPEFYERFKNLYVTDSMAFAAADSLYVLALYDSLLANCLSLQAGCRQSPCEERLELLKMDVSPGGQYALHDNTFNLLEPEVNVLARRSEINQFSDEWGNRDSVTLVSVEGEDSARVDVKDLSDSLFIAYWKDRWADSLVRLHPEYCNYLWCTANSNSYAFDEAVRGGTDADSAIARGWFNPADYKVLLKADPFFNGAGLGVPLYNKMADSLRLYSRRHIGYAAADRNILQFVDAVLYCKDQSNGWESCRPDSACRSRSREWGLYKQFYLNLKHFFYEQAKRASSNPVFSNCVNCFIGSDLSNNLSTTCPTVQDFYVVDQSPTHVKIRYKDGYSYLTKQTTVIYGDDNACTAVPKIEWSITFKPGETEKVLSTNGGSNECQKEIIRVACGDSASSTYIPFTDSTCNYTCPGGTYDPHDRGDNLLFHIEYGNPQQPPSPPVGFGNCRFYPQFHLATGPGTSCTYFNVWVCTNEPTSNPVPSYPSTCPDNYLSNNYINKERRYPDYVNADAFLNKVQSSNPQTLSVENERQILDECRSTCEAQADIWMATLKGCTTDPQKLATLKAELIDICAKGCTIDRPFGTSTIAQSIPATYHSFEEAMVGILGAGALSDNCTVELLSSPYPHNKQPMYTERVITETDYAICQKIRQHELAWQASGATGTFQQYLEQSFGRSYSLDTTELADLMRSCTSCNGILKDNVVLPIAFEPTAAPCLNCATAQTILNNFAAKFPGLTVTHPRYETLLTNFFNQRLGFSLSYGDYSAFLDSCDTNGNRTLCNQMLQEEVAVAGADGCTADLFATALTNAYNNYTAYIDSVRRSFRNAYMTRCMNVKPGLTMEADLYEYHYTLYYYDQSGNLVKTVPPEGVRLLTPTQTALVNQYRIAGNDSTGLVPGHYLPTTYQYNSLNQVVQQYSPDGDTSRFWYDRLGRLTASQNKEQLDNTSYSGTAKRFSYTKYDALGRITEVGEKSGAQDIRQLNMLDTTLVQGWLTAGTDRQVTKTLYDEPVNPIQRAGTSRKRVTASIYLESSRDAEGDSTIYGYDISGNVKTLVQHSKALVAADATNGKKRLDYDYDLVSGKVNGVSYQVGKGDQFLYRYGYDAENRLVSARTSRDGLVWTEEARYQYYLHGPLSRVELGQHKVQGLDYAYTLQGWLKGVNGDKLDSAKEMGGDGFASSLYSRVSKDVYAFKLGYYTGDYTSIGGSTAAAFNQRNYTAPTTREATGNPLYNGNISYTALVLSRLNGGNTAGYSYGYDQLNRLVHQRQHAVSATWSNANTVAPYQESIAYDANGNILKYLRRGTSSGGNLIAMDSLSYKYARDGSGNLTSNRLTQVRDQVPAANYPTDIDNQAADNYGYDKVGNLKKDVAEGIQGIDWTAYGKIKAIDKGTTDIYYGYDPGGNRIVKEVVNGTEVTKTFYVRDASGNVLSVYSKKGTEPIHWEEQHLYGSGRLGVWQWDTVVPLAPPVVGTGSSLIDSITYGSRTYELTNHLGNVLATISDKKVGAANSSGVVNRYVAEVLMQREYYPFGMPLPYRQFSVANYRYGFNGIENDGEIKGDGNHLSFGDYGYDPRIGRRWNTDPLAALELGWSPYRAFFCNPIRYTDPTGLLEFDNYRGYKNYAKSHDLKVLGRREIGSQGHWLASDRSSSSNVWKTANTFNLKQEKGYTQYTTISQRADFYEWFQGVATEKGHDIKWAGAASKIANSVDKLTWSATKLFGYSNDELANFAEEGNAKIFQDVFNKLNTLNASTPKKGADALRWDNITLSQEQHLIQPLYKGLSNTSANLLSALIKQRLALSGMAPVPPFPANHSMFNISQRWEYGMRAMGHNVNASQMLNPGVKYEYKEE